MPRRLLRALPLALLLALALAPAAAGQVQPYQQNDYRGFWNILPPGENGLDNGAQLAAFEANGTHPPHSQDQLAMYGDLVHVAPHLQAPDIGKYYKDASFGVKPDDVERTYSPRADVTIVRDKGFGVAHVYGATRAGTMFGAGYIAAEDRLFFIDVLRHLGRAQLSSFVGGSEGDREFDQEEWAIAPYTEDDLQKQVDQLPQLYGAEGQQIVDDANNYVAGINAYISQARLDPSLMPGEYAAINKPQGPDDWKPTDIIATAALVGGIFGKGGGNELNSALVMQSAQHRFGARAGKKVWHDFRSAEDPEAPTTLHGRKRFPYEVPPRRRARGSLAMPDPGSVQKVSIATDSQGPAAPSGPAPGSCVVGGLICLPKANSNALIVSARHSASGHPLAVFGPQTGYFAPQILMDEDLHGPGIDARGASFPGVNQYVELGRGPDYAWSATSAGQDNTDTFAVPLCDPAGGPARIDSTGYRYAGLCRPMQLLERDNSWVPSAADQTPPGSESLRIYRTALGLVTARATIKGKPVAYTSLRSTYMHEVDSARGFVDFNNPNAMQTPQQFEAAACKIGYTFNWLYVDDRHDAYFNSGNNPMRPRGVDPNFPTSSAYPWKGLNGATNVAPYTPCSQHPNTIDQAYLTSWNNKQARGYRASDAQWGFSSVYRSMPLDDEIRKFVDGPRKMRLVDLINGMENAGTVDLRADKVLPYALKVIGRTKDARVNAALSTLRAWVRSGAHRRDLDNNGSYDNSDAVRILDAWWPRWMEAEFAPVLGTQLYKQIQGMLGLDNAPNNGGQHLGSAYQDGWYGYASKDLRTILNKRRVKGRYSRVYCGRGRRSTCKAVLVGSLREALAHDSNAELYGGDPVCQKAGRDGDQKCFDSIMQRPLGAVTQPLIDWVNRPTFQQAVEIQGHRPRP